MLILTVPETELFDESVGEFINVPQTTLELEHSLVSLSIWESKWKKSWIATKEKTIEESLDYIRCMTLNKETIAQVVYDRLPSQCFEQVNAYIEDKMTATSFNDVDKRPSRDIVTAELIYYWMFSLSVPITCETWHLNRLLTLIKVCNLKNAPSKKMSKKDVIARNRELNAIRRQQLGSSG